jgi:hypothetical protein
MGFLRWESKSNGWYGVSSAGAAKIERVVRRRSEIGLKVGRIGLL